MTNSAQVHTSDAAASGIGWGILGAGWIAASFAADLAANGFRLAAVGSRSQDSADAFAAEHSIPHAYGNYDALINDDTVDVIYVATPHPFHAKQAIAALNAGKHVLVEKAFTMTAAEAREVVELAEARGLVVLEAMWTRWLPHMVRLREVLAEGLIGDLRTVHATHNQKLPTDPAHRINNPDLGGGALLDLGIYPISFAWDVLGAPTSIQALSSPTVTGVDRQTTVLFGYGDGQQAVLQFALDTAGPNEAVLLGTEGWIEIEPGWMGPSSFLVYNAAGEVIEGFDAEVANRGMQYQAWELERLVRAGVLAGDVLPPAESVAIMESLDEVRRQIGLRYPGEQ